MEDEHPPMMQASLYEFNRRTQSPRRQIAGRSLSGSALHSSAIVAVFIVAEALCRPIRDHQLMLPSDRGKVFSEAGIMNSGAMSA
ncbi:Hypothetical protein NTJ_00671 [Nesidiocoris tenuis]|uniref:Uncharacterized protein n=1 Tax=Nesidiocoris tenuis TaxID=355587 RepID=A0ABN7A6K2_9HEMI|nr:Hypothetical protein NTJ_00671 [Nesidiocoris tenuis]